MHLPLTSDSVTSEFHETSSSATTRFAFKLFRQLLSGDDSNVFISPAGIMLCTMMMHEATSGETRQEMAQALEIANLDAVDMQLTIVALKSLFGWREHTEIIGANSLWCNHHVHVRPEFAARVREIYDAEVNVLDFGTGGAAESINEWVYQKTKGRISSLVAQLSPTVAAIGLNAIYFKGLWGAPFDPSLTMDGPFTTATGLVKQIPMMLRQGIYLHYKDQDVQAVTLPYRDNIVMYVMLPSRAISARQLHERSSATWESVLPRLRLAKGFIRLPRFKIEYQVQLGPTLKALGMTRAFDPNCAEFQSIHANGAPVWIDNICHRAIAEVNEEGTVAAAVTAHFTCLGVEEPEPQKFEMIVDRPFFVVIREETSGTILFMGSIGDPQ